MSETKRPAPAGSDGTADRAGDAAPRKGSEARHQAAAPGSAIAAAESPGERLAPVGEHRLLLGLNTFGDVGLDERGELLPHARVLREMLDEAELADSVGLHAWAVGEHHRRDFAVSAPEVVLAAAAARTSRIRLASAVTVLSSDDPIRVYQRFATLDALSSGRAEVILGRGSFIESFPLFGFELDDYELLFEEKLALFDRVRTQQPIHWQGTTRAPLDGEVVFPRVEGGLLPTWIGVGGTPESVVRAARYGYPVSFAIIGGEPARFAPLVALYRRALAELGKPYTQTATHSPGHVAKTDAAARAEVFPHWLAMRNRIGRERGWGPASRAEFDAAASPEGALYVGSPETVARKIVATKRALGIDRFDLKYSNGTLPHELMMQSIELFGREVAPLVAELLGAPR